MSSDLIDLSAPTADSPTQQAANKHLHARLLDIATKQSYNLEDFKSSIQLLAELEAMRVEQSPIVDFTQLPSIKSAYQLQVWQNNKRIYDNAVSADWAAVVARYEAGKGFYVELTDGTKVHPTTISIDTGLEDQAYGCRPSTEIGCCISFNIEEAEFARKATEEMLIGQDKEHMHFSVGSLKQAQWSGDFYSRGAPERLYGAFQAEINRRLNAFKLTHGSLTPKMVIKKSDTLYHCLSDVVQVGYRVELIEPLPAKPTPVASEPSTNLAQGQTSAELVQVNPERSRWARLIGR